jgi:hypothetical protein
MMLAIFRNGRVYEGDGFSLNALYPMPSLAHVVLDPRTQTLPEFLGSLPSMVSPLFREDSFDPTTRIRRGRFYTPQSPSSKEWKTERVNHYPYGQPVGGQPASYNMDGYDALQPGSLARNQLVFLGAVNHRTAWHVVGAERLFNNEILFTLRSANTLGLLPEIKEQDIPPGRRGQILSGLEKVANIAHNHMPQPIVEECREFIRAMLAARNPDAEGKDLGKLSEMLSEEGIKSAARIISRLHARGKSAEQEKQAQKGNSLRDVSDEDGELAISLVAFMLREFGWAA